MYRGRFYKLIKTWLKEDYSELFQPIIIGTSRGHILIKLRNMTLALTWMITRHKSGKGFYFDSIIYVTYKNEVVDLLISNDLQAKKFSNLGYYCGLCDKSGIKIFKNLDKLIYDHVYGVSKGYILEKLVQSKFFHIVILNSGASYVEPVDDKFISSVDLDDDVRCDILIPIFKPTY